MTTHILLGTQVKRLLSSVSDHGNQHLTEVETDLVQTTYLLSEAIEKLGASFMAIHDGISAQAELMEQILSGAPVTPELAQRMRELTENVQGGVNAAVTGLQFQDMTSQLIGRTVRRVAGLRDVLSSVGASAERITSESVPEHVAEVLTEVNHSMESQSSQLESVLWKAVSQTHMESGDIELF